MGDFSLYHGIDAFLYLPSDTTSISAALDARIAFGDFGEVESRPRAVRSTVGFSRPISRLDARTAFGGFGEVESRLRAVRSTVGFDRVRCPLSPYWRLRALSLRRSHNIPFVPRGFRPRLTLGGRQGHGHRVRVPQVDFVGFSRPISRFSVPSPLLYHE